jgi:hypothetical protein
MSQKLFFIERNKNNNTVHYDIVPSKSNAINVYWIIDNEYYEALNFIEKKMAYGFTLTPTSFDDYIYTMKMNALPLKKIFIKSDCAEMYIKNELCILKKIYVQATENFIGYPTVEYIDLYGINKQNILIKERVTNYN